MAGLIAGAIGSKITSNLDKNVDEFIPGAKPPKEIKPSIVDNLIYKVDKFQRDRQKTKRHAVEDEIRKKYNLKSNKNEPQDEESKVSFQKVSSGCCIQQSDCVIT
jgi:lysyl-tRNA synthetase class I